MRRYGGVSFFAFVSLCAAETVPFIVGAGVRHMRTDVGGVLSGPPVAFRGGKERTSGSFAQSFGWPLSVACAMTVVHVDLAGECDCRSTRIGDRYISERSQSAGGQEEACCNERKGGESRGSGGDCVGCSRISYAGRLRSDGVPSGCAVRYDLNVHFRSRTGQEALRDAAIPSASQQPCCAGRTGSTHASARTSETFADNVRMESLGEVNRRTSASCAMC